MNNRTQNPSVLFERNKRHVADAIAWLESGQRVSESELADYRSRLAAYAKTGRQYGLPFAIPGDR